MTPETLGRLSALLDIGLDLDERQREAWLATLKGDALPLVPTLRELLARHASKETYELLDRPIAFGAPASSETQTNPFETGGVIGPYRLLRLLGHGGMGEVWLAERADGTLTRKVALKLPHASWASGLAERFAREQDILAGLEHPHIARLYDAGFDPQGRPYMALEFVEGRPIDEYCRLGGLAVRDRVELLLQVADAVSFAHGRLVIHRDLKPGNILVTAEGQVRLLDFGIAKLMQDEATQETALTRLGGRALTLDYASPEQIRGESIGTASDVYSLGVVAFELLAGCRPYRLKRHSAAALEDAIVTTDPPLASRVATTDVQRRQLAGDLDAILNKALKRTAAERYATVNALREDLARWLDGRTVMAQPDSAFYRARRFVGRNRLLVGTGAMVAILLVAAATISLWQASIARREARTAQSVETFLRDVFNANSSAQSDPEDARRTTARELLDIGARRIETTLADAPEARERVLLTLGKMYEDLTLYDQARTLHNRRIALLRQLEPPDSVRLATGLTGMGLVALLDNDVDGARTAFEEAGAIFRHRGDDTSFERGVLESHVGYMLLQQRHSGALAQTRHAVAVLRAYPPSPELLEALQRFSFVASVAGEVDASVAAVQEGMQAAQALGERGAARMPELYLELGRLMNMRLELRAAEDNLRRAYDESLRREGPASIQTLSMAIDLGQLMYENGEYLKAIEVFRPAADAAEKRIATGDRSWVPVLVIVSRGAARVRAGAVEAGLGDLRRMSRAREILDANPPVDAYVHRLMAEALGVRGDLVDADGALNEAEAIVVRNKIDDDLEGRVNATARLELAVVRHDRDTIEQLVDKARLATAPPSESAGAATRRSVRLAEARLAAGDADGALAAATSALALVANVADRPYYADRERRAALIAAKAHLAAGRPEMATPLLHRAVALAEGRLDLRDSTDYADSLVALGQAMVEQGERDQAVSLARRARVIHDRHERLGAHLTSPLMALEARLRATSPR